MLNVNLKKNSGIDFMSFNREFAAHVVRYMESFVWKKEVSLRFDSSIAVLRRKIDVAEIKERDELLKTLTSQLEHTKAAKDAELATFCPFKEGDFDKALKKALKEAADANDIQDAVIGFLDSWRDVKKNGSVRGSALVSQIMQGMGATADVKTFVRSNGESALKYNRANVVKMIYHVCYIYACWAGTIKPTMIPESLREFYAEKPKKDSKKSGKKTVRNDRVEAGRNEKNPKSFCSKSVPEQERILEQIRQDEAARILAEKEEKKAAA